jgi:hypothetical protein
MIAALLAQAPAGSEAFGRILVNALAVAGAAFLGGLLTGVAVQLMVRGVTLSRVPRWILWALRVLGGVAAGLLVYTLLFRTGLGGGLGGIWGFGTPGSGQGHAGTGEGTVATTRETSPAPDTARADRSTAPAGVGALRIEVLGLWNGKPIDDGRVYRVEGEEERHDLAGVERLIEERKQAPSPLREIDVVITRDSPAQDKPLVQDLVSWAQRNGLGVRLDLSAVTAPAGSTRAPGD